MTLDELKASCPDPLDIQHTSNEDDTVTSSLLHTVVILGLGQEIAVRGSMILVGMRGGRVSMISASGNIGPTGPPMSRKDAEAVATGIGERLVLAGWRTHQKVPLTTIYARDKLQLEIRLNDYTGTQAAKEAKVRGEYFSISLGLVDTSKHP